MELERDTKQVEPAHALGWLRVALVAAVLIAYAPLFTADFTVWDDTFNVSENPRLNPPTLASLGYYWSHSAYDIYIPMTYTVWAGIAKIAYVETPDASGSHLNPYLFHSANVLLHAASALLVFQILLKLLRDLRSPEDGHTRSVIPSAALGAFVFALHPVQVEAVGWVAGLKDVLAGCLSLTALVLYLPRARGEESEISNLRFALATLVVTLAMLSKPIAMMTPLIAMAIDWLVLKRFRRRVLVWLAPAIGCAIIARLSQPAAYSQLDVPLFARPFIAGDTIAFYLYKVLLPLKLGLDYGRAPSEVVQRHIVYLTTLVPAALAILLWIKRRKCPLLLTGAAVFLLAMLPVSGLVRFDFQLYSTVADHYLYLPMLGVTIAAAGLLRRLPRGVVIGCAVVFIPAMGVKTWLQSTVWKDSTTLFNHALAVNPRSWMSHNNLATESVREHRPADAEAHLRAALAIKSELVMYYTNLGEMLREQGKSADAANAYRKQLMFDKSDYTAWTGLGHVLSDEGDLDGAVDAYTHALEASPEDPIPRINLASALAEQGKLDRAIELYQSALKFNPKSPEALEGLARATAERDKKLRPTTKPDENR